MSSNESKPKHTCTSVINHRTSRQIVSKMISRSDFERCGNNAKYFENNQWYCGKHAPSKEKERETKRFELWKKQMEDREKTNNK